MENLIVYALLTAICTGILSANGLLFMLLQREKPTLPARQEIELPEEVEARRAAAEAQRLYEQGFVNLMCYDGSPGRKEDMCL